MSDGFIARCRNKAYDTFIKPLGYVSKKPEISLTNPQYKFRAAMYESNITAKETPLSERTSVKGKPITQQQNGKSIPPFPIIDANDVDKLNKFCSQITSAQTEISRLTPLSIEHILQTTNKSDKDILILHSLQAQNIIKENKKSRNKFSIDERTLTYITKKFDNDGNHLLSKPLLKLKSQIQERIKEIDQRTQIQTENDINYNLNCSDLHANGITVEEINALKSAQHQFPEVERLSRRCGKLLSDSGITTLDNRSALDSLLSSTNFAYKIEDNKKPVRAKLSCRSSVFQLISDEVYVTLCQRKDKVVFLSFENTHGLSWEKMRTYTKKVSEQICKSHGIKASDRHDNSCIEITSNDETYKILVGSNTPTKKNNKTSDSDIDFIDKKFLSVELDYKDNQSYLKQNPSNDRDIASLRKKSPIFDKKLSKYLQDHPKENIKDISLELAKFFLKCWAQPDHNDKVQLQNQIIQKQIDQKTLDDAQTISLQNTQMVVQQQQQQQHQVSVRLSNTSSSIESSD